MSLQATSLTAGTALAGGSIIAISTCLLFVTTGRLAGLSGIFEGASLIGGMENVKANLHWKAPFVGGFIVGTLLINDKMPDAITMGGLSSPPYILATAGLLVGLGTRLGNGCTSGHGICGLGRLSKRSMVAVATFMATGMAVSTICSDLGILGRGEPQSISGGSNTTTLTQDKSGDMPSADLRSKSALIAAAQLAAGLAMGFSRGACLTSIASAVSGIVFAIGLGISGMGSRAKVWNFLTLKAGWDPSLMFVMGSAIPIVFVGFRLAQRYFKQPLFADSNKPEPPKYCLPTKTAIDGPLVSGAILFGAGWGLGGMCPGPAVMLAAVGVPKMWAYFMPAMLVGFFLSGCSRLVRSPKSRVAGGTPLASPAASVSSRLLP